MEYAIPILIWSANGSPYIEPRQGRRETWVPLLRSEFHPLFVLRLNISAHNCNRYLVAMSRLSAARPD
jgi:hypothetical protein